MFPLQIWAEAVLLCEKGWLGWSLRLEGGSAWNCFILHRTQYPTEDTLLRRSVEGGSGFCAMGDLFCALVRNHCVLPQQGPGVAQSTEECLLEGMPCPVRPWHGLN